MTTSVVIIIIIIVIIIIIIIIIMIFIPFIAHFNIEKYDQMRLKMNKTRQKIYYILSIH